MLANKDDPVLGSFVASGLLATRWTNLASVATVNSDNLRDSDPTCDNREAYELQQLRSEHLANRGKPRENCDSQKAFDPYSIPPDAVHLVEASHDVWRVIHFLETSSSGSGQVEARIEEETLSTVVQHRLVCVQHGHAVNGVQVPCGNTRT
jgi:hypothetical protein